MTDAARDAAASNSVVGGLVAATTEQGGGNYEIQTSYSYYTPAVGATFYGNFPGEVASVTVAYLNSSGSVSGTFPSAVTAYSYDANGNRLQQSVTATVAGVVGQAELTQYQYDGQNRLVATVDALGRTNSTLYDGAGHPVITTDVDGRSTVNTDDAIGNLIETAYPDGTVTRMTYDELNHVILSQDRCLAVSGSSTGPATFNVYDAAGRSIVVERLTNCVLVKTNDTRAVVKSGVTMSTVTNTVAGSMVSFTRTVYDLDSRVQYSVAANGTVTQYQYDADGRKISSLVYTNYTVTSTNSAIAPTGGTLVTSYTYDANGNQLAMTDALGRITTYQYDSGDRLVLTTYPIVTGEATAHQTSTTYDGFGNKTKETDEAGVATAYTYDQRGLMLSVTLDAGAGNLAWIYGYDEAGNEIKQTDPNGGATQFEYDVLGRRIKRILPDGSTETTAYADVPCPTNPAFNVQWMAVTDFRGATIVTTNDINDRLATKVLPPINPGETTATESYTYTAAGQVSEVQTEVGSTLERTVYYDYDVLNRLTQKDMPEGVLAYAYTPQNQVAGIHAYRRSWVPVNGAIPAGTNSDVSLAYGYDYLSRLATVTNSGNDVTAYAYDAVGNLAQTTYSNGLQHVYTYNALNRLIRLGLTNGGGAQIHSYSYGLNLAGYRTNVVEMSGGAQTRSVAYDYDHSYTSGGGSPARVYRLTREQIFTGSGTALGGQANVYDLNGNRTTRQVAYSGFTPAQTFTNQSFNFDRRDQIDNDSIPNNDNPNYDANGNTLVDAGVTNGDLYNAENRLIARTNISVTLGYDADGNRVAKTNSGTITYYLIDELNPTGHGQVLAEYSSLTGGTAPGVTYSIGSQLISQNRSGTVSYYGLDGQGSVRLLLSATAAASFTDLYDYDAWGMLLDGTGSTSNSVRYTGQYWDSDLGMNYQRARYYKPNLGRFWTMDTYEGDQEDPLSLHKYLYCEANPVNNDDPTGLYTAGFGYLAEAAIQAVYAADHPGNVVLYGKWTRLGGPLAKAFKLKPDIFNTTTKKWAEIKPLSQSGLARAVVSYGLYNLEFRPFKYSPDAGWNPSTHSALAGSDPIIFFNAGGIIFYSDAISNVKDVLGLTTIAAARAYFLANEMTLSEGLISSLTRIRLLAIGAQGANVGQAESDVSTGVLIDAVGGFAY